MGQTGSARAVRRQSKGSALWNRFLRALPRVPATTVLVLWTAFTVFAFVWIVMSSFKGNQELFASAWSLPTTCMLCGQVIILVGSYYYRQQSGEVGKRLTS